MIQKQNVQTRLMQISIDADGQWNVFIHLKSSKVRFYCKEQPWITLLPKTRYTNKSSISCHRCNLIKQRNKNNISHQYCSNNLSNATNQPVQSRENNIQYFVVLMEICQSPLLGKLNKALASCPSQFLFRLLWNVERVNNLFFF